MKVTTYVILVDILSRPNCNFELIDTDLDCFASTIMARASGKIAGELVGLNVSLAIIHAEVERLHMSNDEDETE